MRKSTNFHVVSRFAESLNTTRSPPPAKDVPASSLGMPATAHLSSNPGPPWSRRMPMCHGPETKAPMSPLMKPVSKAPSARSVGASFSEKNDA